MSAITKINVGGTDYAVGGTQIVTASSKTSLQAVTNLSTSYPGGTRGNGAVDLQMYRLANTQIASGVYSVAMGYYNMASGSNSVAMGCSNTASGSNSVAMGNANTASGNYSVAMGDGNTASGHYSVAMGDYNTASGHYSVALGFGTAIDVSSTGVLGINDAHNLYDCRWGYSGIRSCPFSQSAYTCLLTLTSGTMVCGTIHIINGTAGTAQLFSFTISSSSVLSVQSIAGNANIATTRFSLNGGSLYFDAYDISGQAGVFFTQAGSASSSFSSSGS